MRPARESCGIAYGEATKITYRILARIQTPERKIVLKHKSMCRACMLKTRWKKEMIEINGKAYHVHAHWKTQHSLNAHSPKIDISFQCNSLDKDR